jgi:hypothetical protein
MENPWFRDWIALQASHVFALLVRTMPIPILLFELALPASRAIVDAVRQCYGARAVQQLLPNSASIRVPGSYIERAPGRCPDIRSNETVFLPSAVTDTTGGSFFS